MDEPIPRSPLLLQATNSSLIFVDAQDKLLSLVGQHESVLENLRRLAIASTWLQVPQLVTEQYPEKLGPTSPRLLRHLPNQVGGQAAPKLSFSCGGCAEFTARLQEQSRAQALVVGIETHVCVLQTVLDLLASGLDVFVAVDAVGARHALDHDIGLRRMETAGAQLMTTESALFEWCARAGTDQFRQISQLVRFGADAVEFSS